MKYNIGDKYLFRKKNHAYDGCMVEIEQLSDPMEEHCMVHLEGNKTMRIWVRFDELQLIADQNIKIGDIILYEDRMFLYCRVLKYMLMRYNAIDEFGNGFRIPIDKARKITHFNDRKKFFTHLKANCRRAYDKIMETKDNLIIDHIEQILRLLDYEVD